MPIKNIRLLFIGGLFFFSLLACSNKEGQSQALYETAQFEEQQFNLKHAKQLYEEIIQDYPETSFASKAKTRLKTMEDSK